MTEPETPQPEMSDEDREQAAVWAAELERRNEGSGNGNPNRPHTNHASTEESGAKAAT